MCCDMFGALKMQDRVDIWRKALVYSETLNIATCFLVVFSLYLFNID